jgi:hypothetical protein
MHSCVMCATSAALPANTESGPRSAPPARSSSSSEKFGSNTPHPGNRTMLCRNRSEPCSHRLILIVDRRIRVPRVARIDQLARRLIILRRPTVASSSPSGSPFCGVFFAASTTAFSRQRILHSRNSRGHTVNSGPRQACPQTRPHRTAEAATPPAPPPAMCRSISRTSAVSSVRATSTSPQRPVARRQTRRRSPPSCPSYTQNV